MDKNNLEENLRQIRLKGIDEASKSVLWAGIARAQETRMHETSLSIFNYKKHMIGALIALVIILGGGGAVAASNSAAPGDALYGLDLAVEKAKINFTADADKKDELRVKFADERVAEAKAKSNDDVNAGANTKNLDLSAATVTDIEVDVFTNETTVKIEANDRHYGFVTAKKTKAEIVAEISAKYNLTEEKVNAIIDFEVEDRASRPEDKTFLNSSNSGSVKIRSEKEKHDFELSLQSLSDMDGLSAESQAKLNAAINEIRLILEANPDSKIKIENGDFKIEVKENGLIKFDSRDDDRKGDDDNKDEDKNDDDNDGNDDDKGHGNDDDGEDDDNPGVSAGVNIGAGVNLGGDKKESDDEVFCRGEWRDAEDCEDSNSDDEDEDNDDDNSGSNSNDDDEEDDDDNSGHGN